MTRSYNTRSAGKRKRSHSNSSAEDVDQSPPEAVKKSSKKKTKSKQRKFKHSNLESEADFSLGSEAEAEAEAEAEKRGRAKGGKKKSKAPKNPPKTKASSESESAETETKKNKRPTIPKEANVPPPAPSAVKPDHARSHQSKEIAAEKDGQRKALLWSKYAPAFRLDISLEKLFALHTNNRNELDKYAEYCDGPLQSTPVLPFSAKYYDSEEKLVVALFASRLDEPETIAEYNATHPRPLSAQYAGRTEEDLIAAQKRGDKIYHDGISSTCLKTYWKDVQWLSSQLRPYVPTRDICHDADRGIVDTYVIRNGDSMERIGVHHLVHAWPQQGHENGPLNVSADMVHGSIAAAAVRKYFQATRPVAIFLAQLFKHAFPEHYEEYCAAFDAGVWYTEDPGPWIGRAIVYKLDVQIHFDMKDGGPTATFPMGCFEGGHMEIPPLQARFRYAPGDVLISFSGAFPHRVSEWSIPKGPQTLDEGLTPGHISTVMFFPQTSLRLLKDKPRHWRKDTAFGSYYES
ncbi:hypothetical protein LXA43DRAFT_1085283 [Ganoderma leucocontextum]|nr:hypothetical protein LXA43DRAFT_1085283 [Ganoderma leucocontextum]